MDTVWLLSGNSTASARKTQTDINVQKRQEAAKTDKNR
jgi:hypothetical protein